MSQKNKMEAFDHFSFRGEKIEAPLAKNPGSPSSSIRNFAYHPRLSKNRPYSSPKQLGSPHMTTVLTKFSSCGASFYSSKLQPD
jgi:hypothetical protein